MFDDTSLGGTFTFPGTDLTVKRMGFGAMQLPGPHVWGPPKDEAAALAVLRAVIEAGVDHIDTADFYGPEVSNRLIRKALWPYPDDLVIVSKIGARRGDDQSWIMARSPDDYERQIQNNLEQLEVDAIDIVNLRFGAFDRPNGDRIADSVRAAVKLQERGLIRHIGLSTVSAAQIREAQAITPIVCVQNFYNVANRQDDALIDDLAEQGIAYVPYFPLGGFNPLQSGTLSSVAERVGATPMQVAQAWLLHRAPNILLIPGTSSVDHLHENLAAAAIELPTDALRELDGIGAESVAAEA
jgi:pyridoxine 4-dehydrogenase